jgi:drug/metabolite transporter (DMT)-like permease
MRRNLLTKKPIVAAAAIFCCALWGISTPLVKMGYAYLDSSHLPSLLLWVGLLFLCAGLLTVGAYSLVSKKPMLPKAGSWKGVALIAVLQTVLQYSFLYIGLQYTTSVKGAILKSTDVFFVTLLASLLFKLEKLTAKKLLSCVIGFLGIIIMNLDGLSLNISPLGDGLVVLSILSYSFGALFVKLYARDEDPIVLSGCQMALGGMVVLLAGALLGGKLDFIGMLPIFLTLALIYAVSYTLWTVLLKHNSPSGITIFSFMTPVFGVLFSALLLNEEGGVAPLSLVIALILVCIGVLLGSYEKKAPQ